MKEEIKKRMLNDEQLSAVRSAIVSSMRNVYVDMGALPGDGFENAASIVADKILKNVQMSLMEKNVYKKIANSTKPLKVIKKKKNGRK